MEDFDEVDPDIYLDDEEPVNQISTDPVHDAEESEESLANLELD